MLMILKKYRMPLAGMLVGVLFVRLGVYGVEHMDYRMMLVQIFLMYAVAILVSMGIIFKSRASGEINPLGFMPALIAIISLCSSPSPNWLGMTRYLATGWTIIVGIAITGISFVWFIYIARRTEAQAKLKNDEKAKN